MGGVAAFTSYEVLGTILGLFGIGVCANGIAANSDTIQKNLQGMMDKVYDHAHSFNKWVDKGEAWINDKLDSWWELWKGGVIDMSDEAMDFFRSFAGTQYEEMKMPSGAEKKLHFEAGTTLVSIGLDYTGVTYGFNYTQFLEPVDIVLFDYQKHIGKCLLIMSSDGSSEIDYIGSSKRWLSSYQEALKGLQIAPGVNPDSRDSPFIYHYLILRRW